MTALVTKNLHLLCAAPAGIQRLRDLILRLAFRGKLVEQDPGDEPASELLASILKEKARLASSGEARRRPSVEEVAIDGTLEVLPATWVWTALPSVYSSLPIRGNQILSSEIAERGRFPVVDQGKRFVAGYTDKEDSLIRIPGPVVVFGDHTTERKYIDFDFVAGADGVKVLHPILVNARFFWWQLVSLKLEGRGYARHFKVLNECSFALPPINEQVRIVAKVDELMALCDRLEAEQADAEVAHAKLVEALLASLTQARDAADFRASWQQLAEHFHTLFTTDDSVEALRNSIFELAARGRLAEQRSADGSAASLITRLQAHKEQLAKQGGLRLPKPSVPVDLATVPFSIPESWCWARWNEIALKIGDIDHKMPESDPNGVPFVSPRDFLSGNVIDFDGAKRVARADFERLSAKIRAERGDLIYPRYGTIGENVLVEVDREFLVSYSCAVIKVATGFVDPRYQFYVSLSRCIRNQAKAAENKTTQANVGIKSIQEFLFPVPPFEEQRRIVAKVDELLNLCDQLKLNLALARQRHEHLASVLVEMAVA